MRISDWSSDVCSSDLHGYAEHAGRYDPVAARLTAAGYAVYAVDHWGHGRSDGTMGFVPASSLYVDGMAALVDRVREAWPDKPRLLLGHSMGGLIAALLLIERQGDFAAAALSRSEGRRGGKKGVLKGRSRWAA